MSKKRASMVMQISELEIFLKGIVSPVIELTDSTGAKLKCSSFSQLLRHVCSWQKATGKEVLPIAWENLNVHYATAALLLYPNFNKNFSVLIHSNVYKNNSKLKLTNGYN